MPARLLAPALLLITFAGGCATSEERAHGRTHPSLYDEWIGAEEPAQRATRAELSLDDREKPIGEIEPLTEELPAPAPERAPRVAPEERPQRRPAPEAPRGIMISDVGAVYPLPAESERAPAQAESVCPVEPSTAISAEVLREMDERSRYRHPEGSAARVAGGPPEGFERPPGSTANYGHAWPGGFERAPGTADDLPTSR